ncbi:helix-turn-helix domain-containing protein [Lactobacillus helveticus]|uniref:helix-turn-helix domain-containing protein n=1 Tax=Lactobacillus helveticus TaxID=1587 RepID=UPI001D130570
MDKNCSINTVCNNLNISRSYLYTLFIKKMNLSPRSFLKQLRINEAKKKLCNYVIQRLLLDKLLKK